jgi:hypothetical protein
MTARATIFRSITEAAQGSAALVERNMRLQIPVSFYRSKHENRDIGINRELSWAALGASLQSMYETPFERKEDAPLFSPTVYSGTRCKANATTCGALALDSDGGVLLDPIVALLIDDGLEAIAYTSASNKAGERWRIVLPLLDIVSAEKQACAVKALRDYIAAALGVIPKINGVGDWDVDRTKLNPWSLFYTPGQYACAGFNEFHHVLGDVLSGEEWLEAYPQPEPVAPAVIPIVTDLSRNPEVWDIERHSGHILSAWRGVTSNRHYELSRYAVKIGMSAINRGYDLTVEDLHDILRQMHRDNTPSSEYTDKELLHLAEESLRKAIYNIGDMPAFKKKALAEAARQAEWERIGREIRGEFY